MDAKLIEFDAGKEALLYQKACKLAQKEMHLIGEYVEPFNIQFHDDNLYQDILGCEMALFVIREKAFLRRFWKREGTIKYNRLMNLEEIKKTAPKSTAHMKKNALKILQTNGPR